MNVEVGDREGQLDRAADAVVRVVRADPSATIGLATGNSPIGLYERLIAAAMTQAVDFRRCRFVQLDEYVGLDPEEPRSFRSELSRRVLDPLGLPRDRLLSLDPWNAASLEEACSLFEEKLARLGPVTLQILGIGANGHIGFNEPMSSLSSRTHVVRLHSSTRHDAIAAFGEATNVPTRAITQGIGTILGAERILLLAFGHAKASALAAAIEGPVQSAVPASALQLHPQVDVFCDRAAAAQLRSSAEYATFMPTRAS